MSTKRCEFCGAKFELKAHQPYQQYCSNKCSHAGYRSEYPEYGATYQRNLRNANRSAAFAAYGNKCACCGELRASMLTIDHINNDGHEHRLEIGHDGNAIYRWLKKNNYPEGFQVLCSSCHISKTRLGVCEHQLERRSK